jgi:hypothetical protein
MGETLKKTVVRSLPAAAIIKSSRQPVLLARQAPPLAPSSVRRIRQ